MATEAQARDFINKIAPLIQKYARLYEYKCCSAIIAQACCESAFGQSSLGYQYHNYFGLKCGSSWKGPSVNMSTKEEYTIGQLTNIRDNFRVFSSMEDGVKGYFTFVSTPRYSNLKTAEDYKQYAELVKADGYATSSTYVNTLCSLVTKYGLDAYDKSANVAPFPVDSPVITQKKDNMTIAREVIAGKWGNGAERKRRLTEAGYNYANVQSIVNLLMM